MYRTQAAELETQRYRALCQAINNSWMISSINRLYDHQHVALISRIEGSLSLVEEKTQLLQRLQKKQNNSQHATVKEDSSLLTVGDSAMPVSVQDSKKKHNYFTALNPVAVRIMSSWYERNKEHPYPSYDTCEVMAKAARVTVEQVKKWFANRRLREGNTKSLTVIASRRKRVRTDSTTEILLVGSKQARD